MKYVKRFESFSINSNGELDGLFDNGKEIEFEDKRRESELDKLNGKYRKADAEIDTNMEIIAIGHRFYLSGHEALDVIQQIYDIWMEEGCDREDAVMLWYDHNVL
jgi:hypothetical protein